MRGGNVLYLSEKSGKEYKIELVELDDNDLYRASAISDSGDVMGTVTFNIQSKSRTLWIRKIETNPEFQNQGVGKALLDVVEYFAVKSRCSTIEGKFFPDNEYARPFYLKNNYEIYKDGYETYINKYISHGNISSDTMSRIVDFEILPLKDREKEL